MKDLSDIVKFVFYYNSLYISDEQKLAGCSDPAAVHAY